MHRFIDRIFFPVRRRRNLDPRCRRKVFKVLRRPTISQNPFAQLSVQFHRVADDGRRRPWLRLGDLRFGRALRLFRLHLVGGSRRVRLCLFAAACSAQADRAGDGQAGEGSSKECHFFRVLLLCTSMAQHWHQFNLTASSIPACRENWRQSAFFGSDCALSP